ncbi:hypothetical protein CRG98_006715 [Punica granatum]|uniref:Uncharacterized protein n=1 Tax=Punica granatum TaxID=22663 RepID=A0A2I0KX20_PUNGR|nr:hypothetical protein CRG98_006715 [Punica granatum]
MKKTTGKARNVVESRARGRGLEVAVEGARVAARGTWSRARGSRVRLSLCLFRGSRTRGHGRGLEGRGSRDAVQGSGVAGSRDAVEGSGLRPMSTNSSIHPTRVGRLVGLPRSGLRRTLVFRPEPPQIGPILKSGLVSPSKISMLPGPHVSIFIKVVDLEKGTIISA